MLLVHKVYKVILDQLDFKDFRVGKESQDLLVIKDFKAMSEFKDQLVQHFGVVLRVIMVLKDFKDFKVKA